MSKTILFTAGLLAIASTGGNAALELTSATYDDAIAGKSAFIKFLAPWCGHCKSMKPAWDQLSDKYADHKSIVVADVDCTVEKDLCQKIGVSGYPTIKYFTGATAATGDKYEGGRDYASLEKFADENLGPSCGPDLEDLCSEEQLVILKEAQALSADELKAAVDEKQAAMDGFEADFKAEVEKLQATYQSLMDDKDKKIADASPALRMYQAVINGPADGEAKDEL